MWTPSLGRGISSVRSPEGTEVPYARWIDIECATMDSRGAFVPEDALVVDAAFAEGTISFAGSVPGNPLTGLASASVELHFDTPSELLLATERIDILNFDRGTRCAP